MKPTIPWRTLLAQAALNGLFVLIAALIFIGVLLLVSEPVNRPWP